MLAIPYEPKSPSPESLFARNQRRIREYELAREQEDIRAHYRCQIDEVIEGKRRVLREALYPKSYLGPRTIPLDPALKVTVAYHPGDLKFSLMREPSSSQPRREMFEVEHYWSSVTTTSQITDILAFHGLSLSGSLKCRPPANHERSCFAPGGRDAKVKYAAWSQEHMRAGALLPLKSFFKYFTDFVGLAPVNVEFFPCEFYSQVKLYATRHPERASHDGEGVGVRESLSLGEGLRPLANPNFTLAMRGSPAGHPRAPHSSRHQASSTLGRRRSASLREVPSLCKGATLLRHPSHAYT